MASTAATSEKVRSKGLGVPSAGDAGSGMSRRPVGLAAHMEGLRAALAAVVSELDPDCLTGRDAALLYRSFAALEHLSVAGKTLLAPRIDASGFWREDGHRDASSLLATLGGVSAGQARKTLVNGRRLDELPATEDVLRQGQLSEPKITELTGAGVLDPSHEAELLEGVGDEPLSKVKERCRRTRAASAAADPLAATRRIRAERHFSSWIDPEGAFCYQGRDTADRGARILDHLGHVASCLRKNRCRDAESGGGPTAPPTRERALRADALFALLTQQHVDPGESDPTSRVIGGLVGERGRHRTPGPPRVPASIPLLSSARACGAELPAVRRRTPWTSSPGRLPAPWWSGQISTRSSGATPCPVRSARSMAWARSPSPWPKTWPTTRYSGGGVPQSRGHQGRFPPGTHHQLHPADRARLPGPDLCGPRL